MATISVCCPQCHAQGRLDESAVGRKVACKNCGTRFTVLDAARGEVPQTDIAEVAPPAYPVTVDYHWALKRMIAAGNYDWVDPELEIWSYPAEGKGSVQLVGLLVGFGEPISTEAALVRLGNMGFRPATLMELLAFGAQYPEEQRKSTVIGPGGTLWTVVYPPGEEQSRARSAFAPKDPRRVPLLCENRGRWRELHLFRFDTVWKERCRFLAFPK